MMNLLATFLGSGKALSRARKVIEEVILEAQATRDPDVSKEYEEGWDDAIRTLVKIGQRKAGVNLW